MHATEIKKFENISATTAGFPLTGGRYSIAVVATFGGGSVGLQILGPDGSTWLAAMTALTVAGIAAVELPSCTARIAIVTSTGVYASVVSIPNR